MVFPIFQGGHPARSRHRRSGVSGEQFGRMCGQASFGSVALQVGPLRVLIHRMAFVAETRVRATLVPLVPEGNRERVGRPWRHVLALAAIVCVSVAAISYGFWSGAPPTYPPMPTLVPGVTPI